MEEHPVALITGGTRRIGLAIARRFARDGFRLALAYQRDEAAAAQALLELRSRSPRVIAIQADVTTPEGAERAVHESQRIMGAVDVLVNNVGPFVPSSFIETELDSYRLMVDGNLGSVFHMCQAVLPLMRQHQRGVIVNMGSLNAEVARGAPNAALYHALKAAVVVLTRSLARSEGPHGIRANVVNPGMVDTLGVADSIVNSIPLKRLGEPEDIANAVAWLAGPEAGYINGAVLNVHGGLWV